jgi:hypothetical protein
MRAQALSEDSMTGSRKGKMQIGGHFDPRDVFTLQEVLAGVVARFVQNRTLTGHAYDACLWLRF